MYLSLGNVLVNASIGMLLIDFLSERPSRMRIEGTASIAEHNELAWEYPGAQFVVRVKVERLFPNCPRYIHRMALVERSPYVPRNGTTPPIPEWKRSDWAKGALPAGDAAAEPPATSRVALGPVAPASSTAAPVPTAGPADPQRPAAPARRPAGALPLPARPWHADAALRAADRALAVAEAALSRSA